MMEMPNDPGAARAKRRATVAGRHYGEVRAALQRAGTPIGNNDLWIAAHALALSVPLVSNNLREFERVPGLKLENWV